jgi:threonyl-tRNA synthetase
LEYTNNEGLPVTPVMIHFAMLGSIERFLSVYIEHTAGNFPVWLAPEQVRLITVNHEPATIDFAAGLQQRAKDLGLRVMVDNSNESVGKKIRDAEVWKVPYSIVIGEKEITGGDLTPRIRKDLAVSEESKSYSADEFFRTVANEAKSRTSKTSL